MIIRLTFCTPVSMFILNMLQSCLMADLAEVSNKKFKQTFLREVLAQTQHLTWCVSCVICDCA